ncbi:MAG: diacylglycerol kinase family lipid kinase [Candidatus Bipolaricaulota bacterium]|nr:diacylglycerol kinase family lipid kinase [Candidatus Bipolaricaulota bacterium]
MEPVYVILNPAADRGRAGAREGELRQALRAAGLSAQILRTERPGHGTELARRAVREGVKAIAAAGGDGTVHEVAQALVGTDACLGILPMGSGNDYIRALGIPKDLAGAVAILARGEVRTVDVAEVAGEFALNSFGMGVEGQIAADYKRMRFLKGELGYLYATILEVVRFRAFRAEVAGDGWSFAGKLLSVSVMNGPYAGGGYRLAPHARVDDGALDVGLIGNYPRLVRFAVLPKTRDGSYLQLKRVHGRRSQRVRIRTDRPLPVHMDGELLPEPVQGIEVALRPQALRVVA